MEIEQVFKIAEDFRQAIIKTPKSKFRTSLGCTKFPRGCCDDASQMLAAFLSDKGLKAALGFPAFTVAMKESYTLMFGFHIQASSLILRQINF